VAEELQALLQPLVIVATVGLVGGIVVLWRGRVHPAMRMWAGVPIGIALLAGLVSIGAKFEDITILFAIPLSLVVLVAGVMIVVPLALVADRSTRAWTRAAASEHPYATAVIAGLLTVAAGLLALWWGNVVRGPEQWAYESILLAGGVAVCLGVIAADRRRK
jgi:hypothetical protein